MSATFNWGVRQGYEMGDNNVTDLIQRCADVAVGGAGSFRVYYYNPDSSYYCELADDPSCDTNFQPDSSVGDMYVYQRAGATCA